MIKLLKFSFALFLVFSTVLCHAQTDSLVFADGSYMVGEIKSLDKNVLTVSTDYSDSDFKIEWEKVAEVYTTRSFQISLVNRDQFYGKIESISDSSAQIDSQYHGVVPSSLEDIVYLNQLKQGFKNKFSAYIDLGFNLTAANNLRQITTRSGIGYKAEKWASNITFNTLNSEQNETEPIRRTDGGFTFRYILARQWYVSFNLSFLSNTEQKLDLRSNTSLNVGKFLIRTNHSYWNLSVGANRNLENFSNETPDRDTWEAVLSTELDLYDIGDFAMFTMLKA